MIKAAFLGVDITKALIKKFPVKYAMQNRFRTLLYALSIANPFLRLMLLNGKMTVQEFVNSNEKDLANDETKKMHAQVMEEEMQAKRTDNAIASILKNNVESKMY